MRHVIKHQRLCWSSLVWAMFLIILPLRLFRRGYGTVIVTVQGLDLESLLHHRAAAVRKTITTMPDPNHLHYPSSYEKPDGTRGQKQRRGFCNWIVPHRVMIGQYPGQNPEVTGPSKDDVQTHIQSILQQAGITMFCCLQSELPAQDDDDAWGEKGEIYLEPQYRRQNFPHPFTRYAPLVRSINPHCTFLHAPIEDLSVPHSQSLQRLLLQLLDALVEEHDPSTEQQKQKQQQKQQPQKASRVIYIHCWGGRGRAGLVGSCLLSLLWPEWNADQILNLIQAGYDTREGADQMPPALSQSPQTESQRQFVRAFVQRRQQQFLMLGQN